MDCTYPRRIKNPKTGQWIEVPCGACMACRIARVRDWTVRLLHESSSWKHSIFLTLTYNDENVPVTNCGKHTLLKSDLQKFWKRLRKSLPSPTPDDDVVPDKNGDFVRTLKYFACGEYGDLGRPHYHAIVFGIRFDELKLLQSCWSKGFVTVKYVIPQRIRYVCGYVEKKMYYDKKDFLKAYGCRVPPFQLMSQGLGYEFFEENRGEYLHSLRNTIQGVSYSFPRYYSKKDENLKLALSIIGERSKKAHLEKVYSVPGLVWQESEIQRDMNLKAKAKLKKGKLQ